MVDFLKRKHTTVTQLVTILLTAAVGVGRATGWYNLSETVVASWGTLAAVLWALIGARTVTSNVRLTGKAFAGHGGIDPTAWVAAVTPDETDTAPADTTPTPDEITAALTAAGLD